MLVVCLDRSCQTGGVTSRAQHLRWLLAHQAGTTHPGHEFLPLVDCPVLKKDHTRIGPRSRFSLVDNFRFYVDGISVEHWLGKLDLVNSEFANVRPRGRSS